MCCYISDDLVIYTRIYSKNIRRTANGRVHKIDFGKRDGRAHMYCINCGSRIDDNSKFCPSCGAPVKQQAPNETQAPNSTPDTYTPQDNTPPIYTPPAYTPPVSAPQFYTQPVQQAAAPKKRSIIIICAVAAVVVIGVIAALLLFGKGGGGSNQVSGKVIDAEAYLSGDENSGLENVQITVSNGKKVVAKKKTSETGEYVIKLNEGSYTLTAEYDGYIAATFDFVVSEGEETYLQLTKLVTTSDSMGTVSGSVIDSLTGEPVYGAAVSIKNSNSDSQFQPLELTTDDYGIYTADLPAGYYTVDINVIGYSKLSVPIIVIGGQTVDNQNGALTPILEAGQLRIVLTWGEKPLDLDSHLTGPSAEGKPFHIYYNHKTSDYNGEIMADLDLDDTTSYGPETTTIYNAVDGTYSFYIHDYTNRESENCTALADSGAKVQVYEGDSLLAEYNVPTSLVGTAWHVFDFTAGEISSASVARMDIDELDTDEYDSGWTRIEGKKIPMDVTASTEDFTAMGFTEDMTLLDLVDVFGLPMYYDSIDALRADMEAGELKQEEDDDNPMCAYWEDGTGITYAKFEVDTWKVKIIRLDTDIIALPYGIKSGMTFDEIVSTMKIDPTLGEIIMLDSVDSMAQYCKENKVSGKIYENGYLQVFLTNGSFGYCKYTYDVDGYDELDYNFSFYTKNSILSLNLYDNVLGSAYLSFKTPPED